MTPRALAILAATALLATAGATWLLMQRASPPGGASRPAVLPELAGRLDALTQLRVVAPGNVVAVTLRRSEAGWVVDERAGHPADAAKLRRTVLALAELRVVETKTSDPALHARLGVEDVAAPAAQGVRVEITGADGTLRLILGKPAGANGAYVRREGEAQSLEAAPALAVERDPRLWLDRRLLSLESRRVRSIDVTPLKGRPYAIRRERADQADFRLVGGPPGRKPYDPAVANPQAQALASLEFEDVRPVAEVDFAAGPGGRAVYRCFDGLVITLEGAHAGGRSWLRVRAEYDPQGASGNAVDVEKEAAALARRTGGWAYELPAYRLDGLLRPVEDFLGP